MKARNYATFKDGHEEDIFYYKDLLHGCIIFSTKSGIYFYRPKQETPGVYGLESQEYFIVQMIFDDNSISLPKMIFASYPYIRNITIDRRVERKFTVPDHGNGTILVDPDASQEEIACAIMNELGVILD